MILQVGGIVDLGWQDAEQVFLAIDENENVAEVMICKLGNKFKTL